ncbi:MAG TPA: hypothetical protein DHM37_07950 [Candidatus Cloacimonas sp.]|nr:hypothetical protein [Candidatus Cloacimonadota bacterium]HCX73635.1 hypothetical protein [Candidatus Cloacimonas sp.]
MRILTMFFLICLLLPLTAELDEQISDKNDRVFENIEKDFKLAKYFFSSPLKHYTKDLEDEDKRIFLKRFWENRDPNPVTSQNEFVEEVKVRVNYANTHFSHYQDGWESARGRIYIKYGPPFEIINDVTGINTKYTQKEYQVWKYRLNQNTTYIFLDLGGYGDYRLIYSENDDDEITLPDWRSYLGNSFKESYLY